MPLSRWRSCDITIVLTKFILIQPYYPITKQCYWIHRWICVLLQRPIVAVISLHLGDRFRHQGYRTGISLNKGDPIYRVTDHGLSEIQAYIAVILCTKQVWPDRISYSIYLTVAHLRYDVLSYPSSGILVFKWCCDVVCGIDCLEWKQKLNRFCIYISISCALVVCTSVMIKNPGTQHKGDFVWIVLRDAMICIFLIIRLITIVKYIMEF